MLVLVPVCFVGVFSFCLPDVATVFACLCCLSSCLSGAFFVVTAPARSKGGCILRACVYYWPYRAIPKMMAGEQRVDERSELM